MLTLGCYSQSTLKFVDSETGEPVCGFYSNIYKNGNTFANCGATNEIGLKKIRVRDFDSLATYQISVSNLKYEPIWKEIDLTRNDTLTISVKKNQYYIASSNELLSKGCSQYSFSNYYPKEPRSLSDLPKNIAEKVSEYLKNRVGSKNYSDFNLIGGQIIEIDEYKKRNPKSKTKIAYYLCFGYRNLESGIAMYSSKIHLDENGNILKDIGFPKTKNKVSLISLSEIKKKATDDGYYKNDKTKIAMEYFSKSNILVWKFVNETYNKDYTYLKEEIFYNAFNGKFIRVDSNKGEWID
ncbi:hypothetical protein [uncultured Lacinutrix sp.]|uniref:hypothetical protein n=1 Tax=uncultured Lacinutrix sp. TaxID=574032 RepID=UPI0026265285|nr:hypothetical protein [uncultured Lacinutrix sp.]